MFGGWLNEVFNFFFHFRFFDDRFVLVSDFDWRTSRSVLLNLPVLSIRWVIIKCRVVDGLINIFSSSYNLRNAYNFKNPRRWEGEIKNKETFGYVSAFDFSLKTFFFLSFRYIFNATFDRAQQHRFLTLCNANVSRGGCSGNLLWMRCPPKRSRSSSNVASS